MTTTTQLTQRLAAVRARIAVACDRSGRDPAEVQLVGVSKTHGLDAVREALDAGLVDLGENRAQELVPKAEDAASAGLTPRWHFIGQLQRNKVRQVLPHISVLHSLDSERLLREIERRTESAHRLDCYVEVNVAGEQQKHGLAPSDLAPVLQAAARSEAVLLRGLMTVAPLTADAEEVRPVFRELAALAAAHGLEGLSMGMTDDFEVAIEEGATLVRVGRAIFGPRRERTG
jgi:pyridoxal phosphate enzyme (YggS family)